MHVEFFPLKSKVSQDMHIRINEEEKTDKQTARFALVHFAQVWFLGLRRNCDFQVLVKPGDFEQDLKSVINFMIYLTWKTQ